MEFKSIQPFIFNSFDKTFSYSIIPAISFPAHTLFYFSYLSSMYSSTLLFLSLASESLDFKKPSESRIFEFDKKLFKYGTLQAQQK